ncbi:hypothetical protein [Nocardia sp. NPDC004604]|uniref:hypothetical protein n=1 Tax=Nocardia sp. NPDC004604 TaxID=3157013 RepID=UPI0033A35B59
MTRSSLIEAGPRRKDTQGARQSTLKWFDPTKVASVPVTQRLETADNPTVDSMRACNRRPISRRAW